MAAAARREGRESRVLGDGEERERETGRVLGADSDSRRGKRSN